MDIRFHVRGGTPLYGDVRVSGSKNASLPLLAASLLCSGETVLTNMPRLRDTEGMIRILEFLGATVAIDGTTVRINADRARGRPITHELVSKLRGSIVLLGPLLARFGVAEMGYPGGCVLGKRPVHAHIEALEQMGAVNMSNEDVLHLQGRLRPGRVILPEFSVTATENALMAAALTPGETRIDLAAAEPHVQDLVRFLTAAGAQIAWAGPHTLVIRGTSSLKGVEHRVTPDYLEVGALSIAALVTRGRLTLHDIDSEHLVSFLDTLRRGGVVWQHDSAARTLTVDGERSELRAMKVQTNIFPGFPTDLLAPLGVAMTQASGVSRIFEILFEGRMAYLYELEKMGAHVEVLNAHQALIIGPRQLRGRVVASNDIRAGVAMVLAALCAEGETTITDVHYIERGYDRLEEKLRSVGAHIERVATPKQEATAVAGIRD
ncbi:MAG: UDP-N-acetylglucosamine 1-carboxyvinyltransferase [Candidatus Peregrinibacteria bacterium Gr01-1014_25]|nr:MAG: UDP-N-acetylglucosamine 1-carboxyvinyltransferase [Candidatus Peregrinibacteria bacterium Gr01-1014_25]